MEDGSLLQEILQQKTEDLQNTFLVDIFLVSTERKQQEEILDLCQVCGK
jgi:hypothetical protein